MINWSTEYLSFKNLKKLCTVRVDIARHCQKGPVQSELCYRHLLAYMFDQLSGRQAAKDGNLFIPTLPLYSGLFWHLPNTIPKALCVVIKKSVHCTCHAVCLAKPKVIGPQWLKDWSSHLWVHVISSRECRPDICHSLGSGGGSFHKAASLQWTPIAWQT